MENKTSHSIEVDVKQSDTALELSYGLNLSTLRGIERLLIGSSTLIAFVSSYLAFSQKNFWWVAPVIGFIAYPMYTILIRCFNKWYISLDQEDLFVSSGPIPTGADKLLMRSAVDRIYTRVSEDCVDLQARLTDGRVIRLLKNLPMDVGSYLCDQIEDFASDNATEDNYAALFSYDYDSIEEPELITA